MFRAGQIHCVGRIVHVCCLCARVFVCVVCVCVRTPYHRHVCARVRVCARVCCQWNIQESVFGTVSPSLVTNVYVYEGRYNLP